LSIEFCASCRAAERFDHAAARKNVCGRVQNVQSLLVPSMLRIEAHLTGISIFTEEMKFQLRIVPEISVADAYVVCQQPSVLR